LIMCTRSRMLFRHDSVVSTAERRRSASHSHPHSGPHRCFDVDSLGSFILVCPPVAGAYWLGLRRVRGVGPRICRILLERFGSAEKIFAAGEAALAASGIPRPTARNIAQFKDFEPLEKELCELPAIGAQLIRWTDSDYPINLRHIADPPPYFFARGTVPSTDPRCIAVVGTRNASAAGQRMARRLSLELAAEGFTMVSELARGVDSEVHQGALDAGGRTVAVMGSGIDVIYPPEHHKLAEKIVEMEEACYQNCRSARRRSRRTSRAEIALSLDSASAWL